MNTTSVLRGALLAGFLGLTGLAQSASAEPLGMTTSDGPDEPYTVSHRPRTAARCPSGLVWRERFDGDTVCVLPGERDANRRHRGMTVSGRAAACPSGLVWREQFEGDSVCVTPLERDANRRRRGL